MSNFDKLYEKTMGLTESKMENFLRTLKDGDAIEITPEKGKVRKMFVVGSYNDQWDNMEVSNGRKKARGRQRNGILTVQKDGSVHFQPTMLQDVDVVKTIKKI